MRFLDTLISEGEEFEMGNIVSVSGIEECSAFQHVRSISDEQQYQDAVKMPADVLLAAVRTQVENSLFSEAYCLELAAEYTEAAERARARRIGYKLGYTELIFEDSIGGQSP